jgi:hypothetical protein
VPFRWCKSGSLSRARLFVISCIDCPGKPPLSRPIDHFEVHEFSIDNPRELVFGCAHTVTQADEKFLEQLNRGTADQTEIRRALAGINARSAKASNGAVSEGCLLASTTPDGRTASENFGRTPGLTVDITGSEEMVDVIAKAHKGKRAAFIHSRGVTQARAKETTLEPSNVAEGSTLVVKAHADRPLLFVTDSSGNTFKPGPKPLGAKPIDQDVEWEKLEEGTPAGPARIVAFS